MTADLTRGAATDLAVGSTIPRLPAGASPVLSSAQERLWFMEQFAPGTTAYTLNFGWRLRGPLDIDSLAAAVTDLGHRHDSLRMTFPSTDDGRPTVRVADAPAVSLSVIDAPDADTAVAMLQDAAAVPFDLATGPLWRPVLARLAADDHIISVTMHHIVTDGWSSTLLFDDLAELYAACIGVSDAPPPPPTVGYADYAAWQRGRLDSPEAVEHLDYWTGLLRDTPPLELPTDGPRPAEQRYVGRGLGVTIGGDVLDGVRAFAKAHRVTDFMVLLAAWQALLGRYSGMTDFAVGSPVAGRGAPELESVIGLFTNTVVHRADLSGDPSFAALCKRVRRGVIGALGHQDVPFERIVAELGVARDVSRSAVFQNLFSLHSFEAAVDSWPGGIVADWVTVPVDSSRFELALYLDEHDGDLSGALVYNTDLFTEATAERLARHYETLLRGALADPDAPLSTLPLMDDDERAHVLALAAAPAPARLFPAATLADLVTAHVTATPDAPAVVCAGDALTYAELDRRAEGLADMLRARGVGPDDRVGICVEQSTTLAVAVLAILKAGGAYVPLDPEQPAARLAHMLTDAAPGVILTQTDLVAELPAGTGAELLCLDTLDLAALPSYDEGARTTDAAGPEHLAYVIYTSGSTGRPKGVAVQHREVLHYLAGVAERFRIEPGARYALLQSLSFDFSVTVFWLALATGGSVHLVPRRCTGDELATYLTAQRIDYMKMTPSHLAALASDVPDGALLPAKALILGGEASQLDWARQLAKAGTTVFNHYGPTEATVGITTFEIDPNGTGTGTTPIGRPLPLGRVYVLDAAGQPCPVGVPGEIHLGGARLARGYLGQPELTAERFVADPFSDESGARMYRTGDLGRWRADGELEFLGRVDQQVKIRGFRIELGEIEAVLTEVAGAAQTVVVLRNDRLVAYLEKAPGSVETDAADLKRSLVERLPDYMVPARFVWLDALPLQDHGKVDRKALPEPPAEELAGERVAPEGPVETLIAGLWADVLELPEVGVTDDFFDIGGHSLLATQVVARLRRALPEGSRPVSVVDMFKHRTVRELATLAGDAGPRDERLLHELTRPVPAEQRVASLICVPYGGGSAVVYQPLADNLPPGFSLFSVSVPGHDIGLEDRTMDIEEVAATCVHEILDGIPGPLVVYGHCGPGSALAVEIARRLEHAGRDVDAVYVGGIFPFARPTTGLLGRIARLRLSDRMRSDRVHANWLRSMGADLGALDEEQVEFLIRAMRHDARVAEEYYTDLMQRRVSPLRAPVVSVVGDRDPGVEYFEERYKEWHFLTGTAALVVMDEGGHYFLKFRPDELAEIVTTVHTRLDAPTAAGSPTRAEAVSGAESVLPAQAAVVPHQAAAVVVPDTLDVDPPWRLAAVSRLDGAAESTEAATAAAGPRPSMKRFLAIASGQLISMTGTALTEFALPLWVYLSTGSLVRFALFAVLGMLPGTLIAPLAGALIDRSDRRRVIITADIACATLLASVAALYWTDTLQVWHLYGFVAALSVALAFQRLAYNSAIPQIVPKRYLGHANGVSQTAQGVTQFLVPLIAVGLMSTIGLGGILIIDLCGYALALGVLLAVKFPRTMAHKRREPLLTEIAGGFRYSFGQRSFRAMLLFFMAFNLLLAPLFLLVSPMVLGIADLDAVGRVALAGGAGGIAGGVLMTIWGGPKQRRMRGMLLMTLGLGVAAVVIGARPSLWLIATGLFCLTLSLAVVNGVYMTIVQTKVPQRLHGRVLALNMAVAWSTLPLGWAVLAPLATKYAEPLLLQDGPLAGTVGRVIGVGPGRGIGLVYITLGLAFLLLVVVALRIRRLARFDDEVPDSLPDDVVGLQTREERRRRAAGVPAQSPTDVDLSPAVGSPGGAR